MILAPTALVYLEDLRTVRQPHGEESHAWTSRAEARYAPHRSRASNHGLRLLDPDLMD